MTKKTQLIDKIKGILQDAKVDDAIINGVVDNTNTVFDEVNSINIDAIARRDDLAEKLRNTTEKLTTIQSKVGLDDDFKVEDILQKIKKGELSEEVETKYKNDIESLRGINSDLETKFNDLNAKFEDTNFTNSLNGADIWQNFTDEPMAKNIILQQYKDKTIFEDGKLYAKDETTGKVATDLTTGEKLGIDDVTKNIIGSLNPMYLKADVISSGGGSRQTTTTKQSGALKRSEMSASDKAKFITDNGQDAYLKLNN